jgi:hypothetical protein
LDKFKRMLKVWLPLAFVLTAAAGMVYVGIQQDMRHSADDPQIQLSEDAARALASGKSPDIVAPPLAIDIGQSLAPFVTVFDASGKAVASSGLLHSQLPALPPGVFDAVRAPGEDRITWQPEPGVRIATVVNAYSGTPSGFVMSGRSLRETERRVDQLGLLIGAAWLAGVAGIAVLTVVMEIVL